MSGELSKIAEDSARGGFFLIFGSIIAEIISAIASIIVVRFLGPELYGQYVLALVAPQILFLFADLGISQGLIKFSASLRTTGETEQIPHLIKCGMLFRALIGFIIFIVNFALADYFATIVLNRPDIGPYIRIASSSIIFQVIFATVTSAFVGLDKTEYNAFITNIHAVAKAIISVALVLFGLNVAGAVIGHVASYLIASIAGVSVLFFLMKKHFKTEENGDFTHNLRTLMGYGMPLYASLLLTGFVLPYQNLVLGIFTSDVVVAYFKAVTNFVTLITVLSIPITTALLPAFSKLNMTSNGKTKDFFKLANKYTSMLIVPTAVVIMIFSNEIVRIIYGAEFQHASTFLSLYCPLYFLVGIGYLTLTSLFNGLGETRIVFKTTLINFSILLILTPLLTQVYGAPGLIIAFLMSNTIGTSYGAYIAKSKFKIEFATKPILKIYLVSIIAGIPAILLLQFSTMHELINVAVGGFSYLFTYATLIPLAEVVTFSEIEKATEIVQKIKLLKDVIKPLMKYQKTILGARCKIHVLRKNNQQTTGF